MKESNLIPLEFSNIPKISTEKPADLLQVARMYLRDRHIAIDLQTLGLAMRVLDDAYFRGYAQNPDRFKVGKRPPFRLLIKDGLAVREQLRAEANDVIKLSHTHYTNATDPKGPLALSENLLKDSENELSRFQLQPEFGSSTELVQIAKVRSQIIPKLAEKILAHLPAELQHSTIEQFPSIQDQAKLIRNGIIKFIFTKQLSPVITTDQLRRYSEIAKNQPLIFEQNLRGNLTKLLNITDETEERYLLDLFTQVKIAFFNQPVEKFADPVEAVDYFYNYFGKDLLLLHPALEEQRIITQPEKYDPRIPSIWDDGLKIGSMVIPSADSLQRALRQQRAKRGPDLTRSDQVNSLRMGVASWRWRESEIKEVGGRIYSREKLIQQRKQYLQSLYLGQEPLPNSAFNMREVASLPMHRQLAVHNKNINKYVDQLLMHNLVMDAAYQYHEWLLRVHPDGEWPDSLPESSISVISRVNSASARINAYGGLLRNLGRVLDIDPIFEHTGGIWEVELSNSESSTLIVQEMRRFKGFKNKQPLDAGFLEDVVRKIYKEDLQMRIGESVAAKEYKVFLGETQTEIRLLLASPNLSQKRTNSFAKRLIKKAVAKRIEVLQAASELFQKRVESETPRNHLEDSVHDQDRVSGGRSWTKEEAISYIRENYAADVNLMSQDEISGILQRGSIPTQWLDRFPTASLPNVIKDRTSLRFHVHAEIRGLISSYRMMSTNPGKRNSYETGIAKQKVHSRIARLVHFRDQMTTMAPPLPIGEGLSRGIFLNAWKKRLLALDHIIAIQEEDVIKEPIEKQHINKVREIYCARVNREIEALEAIVDIMKRRNPDSKLAEKLRRYNLVLDVE